MGTRPPTQDPALVLMNVCAGRVANGRWTKVVRAWPIRTPHAKLLAKYSVGTSAIFGHYVFCYARHRPNCITPLDVEAADRLMGANISARRERCVFVLTAGTSRTFKSTLEEIPETATIDDAQYDDKVSAAISALCQHSGIQLAIATKLLCIKRPFLVPMMDRLVQDCFGTRDPTEILRRFRGILADETVAARVRELAVVVKDLTGFAPSPVRLLDELIWFDWNVKGNTTGVLRVVGFDQWGYDPAHDERGVYLVGPRS
jgi:hypothetical protein